jgi:hypothetical protein
MVCFPGKKFILVLSISTHFSLLLECTDPHISFQHHPRPNQPQFKPNRVSKYLKKTFLSIASLCNCHDTESCKNCPDLFGKVGQMRVSKCSVLGESLRRWPRVNKRKSPEINEKEPHSLPRKWPIHQQPHGPTSQWAETKSSNQIQVPSSPWKVILSAN